MKLKALGGLLIAATLGIAGLAAVEAPASATVSSIAIAPTYQTVVTGSTVYWGWSWGGSGTYSPKFTYGDGYSRTYSSQTNGGSGSASHVFDNCASTTYTQQITVNLSNATGQTRSTASGGC